VVTMRKLTLLTLIVANLC